MVISIKATIKDTMVITIKATIKDTTKCKGTIKDTMVTKATATGNLSLSLSKDGEMMRGGAVVVEQGLGMQQAMEMEDLTMSDKEVTTHTRIHTMVIKATIVNLSKGTEA